MVEVNDHIIRKNQFILQKLTLCHLIQSNLLVRVKRCRVGWRRVGRARAGWCWWWVCGRRAGLRHTPTLCLLLSCGGGWYRGPVDILRLQKQQWVWLFLYSTWKRLENSHKVGYFVEVFQLFYELEFNDDEISHEKQDMKQWNETNLYFVFSLWRYALSNKSLLLPTLYYTVYQKCTVQNEVT